MWRFLIGIALVIFKAQYVTATVFCYYESWTVAYAPEDIDVNACTHIMYSFLGINDDGTLRIDDDSNGVIGRLSALKNNNPNLKVLFSVGGWNEGAAGFSGVAADTNKLDTMTADAIRLCQQNNYDGLDIDWEYPGEASRGGAPQDRENYINMLRRLKAGFQDHGYLLTAAVSPQVKDGYNVPEMNGIVDYIGLMTYHFHNGNEAKTAENAPLYPRSSDDDNTKRHSTVQGCLQDWLDNGASPSKVILGLAFYGIKFTLADPGQNGMGAPTTGSGGAELLYSAICTNGFNEIWDDEQKVPYRFSGDSWIGYDNPDSISIKVDYAKSNGLGGVMVWALNQDTKDGSCESLLQTIKDNI